MWMKLSWPFPGQLRFLGLAGSGALEGSLVGSLSVSARFIYPRLIGTSVNHSPACETSVKPAGTDGDMH